MADTNAIIQRLAALFVEIFHFEVPSADTDLFESGMLDSLQLVELLVKLEQRFGFRVRVEEIELDDLRTLARLARLIAAQAHGTGHRAAPRSSSRMQQGVTSQEGGEPGLWPRGAESRAGRGGSVSTIASPRDPVPGEPSRPPGKRAVG